MPQHDLAFKVEDHGSIRFIYHPNNDLHKEIVAFLGTILEDRRAGYVWPLSPPLRATFRLLRKVFGGRGRIAAWTRTWSCRWGVWDAETMDQLPGSYSTHSAAVEAEVKWSLAHGFPKHIIGGAS